MCAFRGEGFGFLEVGSAAAATVVGGLLPSAHVPIFGRSWAWHCEGGDSNAVVDGYGQGLVYRRASSSERIALCWY